MVFEPSISIFNKAYDDFHFLTASLRADSHTNGYSVSFHCSQYEAVLGLLRDSEVYSRIPFIDVTKDK